MEPSRPAQACNGIALPDHGQLGTKNLYASNSYKINTELFSMVPQ